jgi:hypothetical protein
MKKQSVHQVVISHERSPSGIVSSERYQRVIHVSAKNEGETYNMGDFYGFGDFIEAKGRR